MAIASKLLDAGASSHFVIRLVFFLLLPVVAVSAGVNAALRFLFLVSEAVKL